MRALPLGLFLLVLRLLGRRRRFESVEGLVRAVARERKTASAAPPAAMRARFRIEQQAVAGKPGGQPSGHVCYRVRPAAGTAACHVLYVHGGAHIAEMSPFHWGMLADLIDRTGCEVLVPIYPLAPEHSHRDCLPMVQQVYREMVQTHPKGRHILMGDSSGAGVALLVAQGLADAGLPQPDEIVLISPWLDLTLSHPDVRAIEPQDPWLAVAGLLEAGKWWAAGDPPEAPHLSPINGRWDGLAPLTVFIGTRDLLWPDCRRLQALAGAAGVSVQLIEAPGMIHVWPLLPLKQAALARHALAGIISGHLQD